MKPSEAEEHLRIIRSLMERATIYRAISAPTALVGGLVSLIVGGLMHFYGESALVPGDDRARARAIFVLAWMGVLAVTGAANTWFLAREAKRRGGSFFSPAMAKALRALIPAVLTAGVFTVIFGFSDAYSILPTIWMIFYGLALLSAAQFSPQAIPRLGWAFLAAGLVCAVVILWPLGRDGSADLSIKVMRSPHLLMAITFGGLHLLYAVCTWSTQGKDEAADV